MSLIRKMISLFFFSSVLLLISQCDVTLSLSLHKSSQSFSNSRIADVSQERLDSNHVDSFQSSDLGDMKFDSSDSFQTETEDKSHSLRHHANIEKINSTESIERLSPDNELVRYSQHHNNLIKRSNNSVILSAIKNKPKSRSRRSIRSITQGYEELYTPDVTSSLLKPVCESISQWVQFNRAEDFEGNTVRVLEEIEPGVKQIFWETRCKKEESHQRRPNFVFGEEAPRCVGADHGRHESACLQGHRYTYAKIVSADHGHEWRMIRIRSSCNCFLTKRHGHRVPA